MDKTRENRLRRKADRMGLRLVKSRRKDTDAIDYGCYMLVDASVNVAVYGVGEVMGLPAASIDDVEKYLYGGDGNDV